MKQACKARAETKLGREFTPEEVKAINSYLESAKREAPKKNSDRWKSLTKEQKAKEIADIAVKNYQEAHLKNITTLLTDARIRESIRHEMYSHDDLNPMEVLIRKIESHTDQKGIQSYENDNIAIRSFHMAKFADIFSLTKYAGFVQDAKKMQNLVREIYKPSPNADANTKELAEQIKGALEDMRVQFNMYGGNIAKIEDYGLPQSHSQQAVAKAGYDKWMEDIFPLLDKSKFIDYETKAKLNDDEIKELLFEVYKTISSNGANKSVRNGAGTGGYGFGTNIRNKYQEHRVIHFKDGDAWLKYQGEYGEASVLDILSRHSNRMSSEIALMKNFGSNPEYTLRQLNDEARDMMMLDNKWQVKSKKVDDLHHNITIATDMAIQQTLPVDNWLRNLGATLRNWTGAAKLGSAWISSLTDHASMAINSQIAGINYSEVLGQTFKKGFSNNADEVKSTLLGFDEYINGADRFGDIDIANTNTILGKSADVTRKLFSNVMRLSMLTRATQVRKQAFGAVLMKDLTEWNNKADWNSIPDKTRKILEGNGVTESDWNFFKKVQRKEVSGNDLLVMESFYKDTKGLSDYDVLDYFKVDYIGKEMSESLIKQQAFLLRDKMATKYQNMILTELDASVAQVGARERRIMQGNMQAGTLPAETLKFFTQFKSFALPIFTRLFGRTWSQEGASKFYYTAGLVAGLTLMGYIANSVRDIAMGRDPMNPATTDQFRRAVLTGGALPFVGDALSASFDKNDRGAEGVFTPAAWGMFVSMFKLTGGGARSYLEQKESNYGHEFISEIQKNTPFMNIFYTRLAFDRLVFANMHNMLDDNYLYKRQMRQESKYDTQYYWGLDGSDLRMPEINNLEYERKELEKD